MLKIPFTYLTAENPNESKKVPGKVYYTVNAVIEEQLCRLGVTKELYEILKKKKNSTELVGSFAVIPAFGFKKTPELRLEALV